MNRRYLLCGIALAVFSNAAPIYASNDPVKADPNTGVNFNRYHYANNNPYRYTDPDGRLSRGSGWSNDDWKTFNKAQQSAARDLNSASNKISNALSTGKNLDSVTKAFEANFGAGTGTAENMGKMAASMGAMAAELRDTGSGAIPANAMSSTAMSSAYSNADANTLAGVPPTDPRQVVVNVDHASFNNPGVLSWATGHETGHAVLGLKDQAMNGIKAYRYGLPEQQQVFQQLSPAQRLMNPDHLMDFAK